MSYRVVLVYYITLCLFVGVTKAQLKPRITSNDYASPGEFPYQVSLQIHGQHFCGGSLISKQHVLTAAHCVDEFLKSKQPYSLMKVAVGTTTIPGGTYHEVDLISRHRDYTPAEAGMNADIAVIRLSKPVVESANVKPIALPAPGSRIQPNEQLIVSGFGKNHKDGQISPYLKKLVMSGVPRSICKHFWSIYVDGRKGLFCAKSPGAGLCQGDSGGPVTIGKNVVVGVVSATDKRGCGTDSPDLLTRVATYLEFIQSKMV